MIIYLVFRNIIQRLTDNNFGYFFLIVYKLFYFLFLFGAEIQIRCLEIQLFFVLIYSNLTMVKMFSQNPQQANLEKPETQIHQNHIYKINVEKFQQLNEVIASLPKYNTKPNKRRHSLKNNIEKKLAKLRKDSCLYMLPPGDLINKFPQYIFGNRRPNSQVKMVQDPRVDTIQKIYIKGQKILDLGCGDGNLTLQIALKYFPSSILGIDLSKPLIRYALKCKSKIIKYIAKADHEQFKQEQQILKYVTFQQCNFFNITLKENEYDTILCFNVIQHLVKAFGSEILDIVFGKIYDGLYQNGALILRLKEKSIVVYEGGCENRKSMMQYVERRLKLFGFEILKNELRSEKKEVFITALKRK